MDSLLAPLSVYKPLMRMAAAGLGAAMALLLFSLAVWAWRDISARSRDSLVRAGAVVLVVGLPAFGIIIYMLLRPRETIAERYERELIEELLAREVSTGALSRRSVRQAVPGS
jgi:sulfite exporter TauE/SafE